MTLMLNKQNDRWVKTMSQGGFLKATAVTAAGLVSEAGKRHNIKGDELIALGQALVLCLLQCSRQKPGSKISISVKGSHRLRQVMVDGSSTGEVRGFITLREPEDIVPHASENTGPWGTGLISIVTLLPNEKEPYVGTCELATGHLAKDFTVYLAQSEQIPAAVGLSVALNNAGEVAAAGGFLVEILPGADDATIDSIENNIQSLSDLARHLTQDSNPTKLLSQIFADHSFTILENHPVTFGCNCTKDRVSRALRLLGKAELTTMAAEDGGAEIKCDFCSESYKFSADDLRLL